MNYAKFEKIANIHYVDHNLVYPDSKAIRQFGLMLEDSLMFPRCLNIFSPKSHRFVMNRY